MGKRITINLRAISPKGEMKAFTTIKQAAEELGFSEYWIRKAYHTKRDMIGEYRLKWLEVKEKDPIGLSNYNKPIKNCIVCGKPLTREDRMRGNRIHIARYDENGKVIEEYIARSLYEASRLTGVSLNAMINAVEKGNRKVTRRRDRATYYLTWRMTHSGCNLLR